MRSSNRSIVALVNALAEAIDAVETPYAVAAYPGASTVFFGKPKTAKAIKPDVIAEYQGAIYYQSADYGVRFYAHPIDGWVVGFEYEPTDDLFPGLIYRSQTAWSKDDKLEAAWDAAIDKHKGLWSHAKPVKQTGKADPKDYRIKTDIYVPLEAKRA